MGSKEKLKVSLIITTYNRVDALEAVLVSVLNQKELPMEVIIGDDGSRKETRDLIKKYQDKFPIPLIHSWQVDDGFRLAESRNKAILLTKGEYIIFIDGDMVLHPHFIYDHRVFARKGCFVQGGRILFTERKTVDYLSKSDTYQRVYAFQPNIEARFEKRLSTWRIPFLSRLLSKPKKNSFRGIKACNMAFFKEDIIKVNGFNNEFVGWGAEDFEFVQRLYNIGRQKIYLKFGAIAYHLYHQEALRDALPSNQALLDNTIATKATTCKQGLKQTVLDPQYVY